ncbi:Hyoscyamine 6-dioxygenase [Linum perenne]
MESFHSANCINSAPHTLSPDLILPEETRPSLSDVSHDPSSNIPIINLTHKPSDLIREISRACEQYGFFQIINHGVPAQLSETTLDSVAGFFESSPEVKAKFNLINGRDGKIRMWSETLSHPWHSLDETIHLLPDHPIEYREVFPRYAKEIGELMSRLLSLIS